jgi:hypothetical protein
MKRKYLLIILAIILALCCLALVIWGNVLIGLSLAMPAGGLLAEGLRT